jgi:DnaK suppressor protein
VDGPSTLDLDHFRSKLESERERLSGALEAVNHKSSLADETGDLSSGPGDHLADNATETFMRELDGGLEENAAHLLAEIDAALARVANGSFGTCTVCGRPIGADRLEAIPWATLCIDDKRKLERG